MAIYCVMEDDEIQTQLSLRRHLQQICCKCNFKPATAVFSLLIMGSYFNSLCPTSNECGWYSKWMTLWRFTSIVNPPSIWDTFFLSSFPGRCEPKKHTIIIQILMVCWYFTYLLKVRDCSIKSIPLLCCAFQSAVKPLLPYGLSLYDWQTWATLKNNESHPSATKWVRQLSTQPSFHFQLVALSLMKQYFNLINNFYWLCTFGVPVCISDYAADPHRRLTWVGCISPCAPTKNCQEPGHHSDWESEKFVSFISVA